MTQCISGLHFCGIAYLIVDFSYSMNSQIIANNKISVVQVCVCVCMIDGEIESESKRK